MGLLERVLLKARHLPGARDNQLVDHWTRQRVRRLEWGPHFGALLDVPATDDMALWTLGLVFDSDYLTNQLRDGRHLNAGMEDLERDTETVPIP